MTSNASPVRITVPQTYDEYNDALTAIIEGRATEVFPCDRCDGTLRPAVRHIIAGIADPTEVIHLACGHVIF